MLMLCHHRDFNEGMSSTMQHTGFMTEEIAARSRGGHSNLSAGRCLTLLSVSNS